MENTLFILIGLVSGISSGLFGIGGGIIIVPSMLSLGLSSHHAIGISVFQMIFASIFGSYLNYKKNNLNIKDGIFIGIGGLIGASFSGVILRYILDTTLTAIFLLVSIIFFIKFIFNKKENTLYNKKSILFKNIILFLSGIFTGVFAISLGIGGGLLITPILAYFLGYDTKKVVPLSLFFIVFASIAGIFSFLNSNIINENIMQKGIIVGISSMIGVFIGIKIMEKIHLTHHKIFLLSIYLISISMTSYSLIEKLNL